MVDERSEEERVEAALAITEPRSHLEWLEPVYTRHAKAVLRAAYRVTGNAADAEDAVQTVFLRLARREQAPDLSRGALPYLMRAATNAALDVVQSRRARTSRPLEDAPAPATQDHSPSPDRLQSSSEIRQLLRSALTRLSRRSAEMFTLRYFEGLDNSEIAETFQTSPGTVAVTLHRARAQLKDELRPYLGGIR